MKQQVLLDTGPLVAFTNRRDRYYEWAKTEWALISPPLLTCEAVITEACFLLQTLYGGAEAVLFWQLKPVAGKIGMCCPDRLRYQPRSRPPAIPPDDGK